MLRCSRATIRRRIDDGTLPAFRAGREHGPLLIRTHDVEAAAATRQSGGDTMKLGARLRGFSDAAEIEGTTTDADRARHDKEVRQARLALARRQAAWTETP